MRSYNPTVSQKLILLDQLISRGSAKYNIGGYASLDGPLSYELFNNALVQVLTSQEVYSTVLTDPERELKCFIGNAADNYRIETIDLSKEEAPEEAAMVWMQRDFALAFEMEGSYFFRFKLLKIDETRHFWYAKTHHLISDGWSFKLLLNQAAEFYTAFYKGAGIPSVSYKYSEYSLDDAFYHSSLSAKEDRAFWLAEHRMLPSELFQKSCNRPGVGTASSSTLYLSAEDKRELQSFADSYKLSLFHVIVGILVAYFSRTRQQDEVVVAVPVLNRTKKVFRSTAGVFMNLLALKFAANGDDTMVDILSGIKGKMSNALRHQRYQYGSLVKDLDLPAHRLLYEIRVSYEDFAFTSEFGNLNSGAVALSNHAEIDKLAIYVRDYHDQGFDIRFVYNNEYFSRQGIESISSSIRHLISSIGAIGATKLRAIHLLDEKERAEVFGRGVGPVAKWVYGSFLELWDSAAKRFSDKTAVSCSGNNYSYKEIDLEAKRLASALSGYKAFYGDVIALVLPRCEKMIVAILGSMMSGFTYIPLGHEYPVQRIIQILDDSGCKLVLCSDDLDVSSFGKEGVQVIRIENIGPGQEQPGVTPGEPCYIIYTSGSTGAPKGVMISHRSMVDYVCTFREYFGVTDQDVVLQQSPITFDTSVEEIFPILASGGRLHILEHRKDLTELHDVLERESISILSTNPLVVRFLSNQTVPASLRLLISGGDELKVTDLGQLWRKGIALMNSYGPTECTVCASYHRIKESDSVIPIGRPIKNREIYIMDKFLQVQPFGVEGEIVLGGEGLAMGYINDIELTNTRFIDDSFRPGRKLFRTGDAGVMMPNGDILFKGRCDDQLTYRGYRIDPFEIERLVSGAEEVDGCIVSVKEFQNTPFLVAYLKYKGEKRMSVEARVELLGDRLPEYMIPDIWTEIAEWPLSINGKIDRRSLPGITADMLNTGNGDVVMPRTKLESEIREIWTKVLLHESIGINDSFFDLGGHSLNIMQLANHFYKSFGVKVSIQELFGHPTIALQAALLKEKPGAVYRSIGKVAEAEDYVVSDGQRRLWVLSQLAEASRAYHVSGQLELEGRHEGVYLERAVQRVIDRHEMLRTVFRENGQWELRQVVKKEVEWRMDERDLRGSKSEEIGEYIDGELGKVFDLGEGPLLRAGLVRVGEERYIFYFSMHHIISDGWSMEILGREVMGYYEGYRRGEEWDAGPLGLQYKDYAAWQQEQLSEGLLEEHRRYWLEQLKGELPVLELPADRVRPAVLTHNGYRLSTVLDGEVVEGLRRLCGQWGGTLFMGLVAGLKALLYRYTGQEDIIVGSPVAGRDHVELEDQIGFYVNTLALRTRLREEDSYEQLFGRVREVTLSGYEHQQYPFDRLVEELEVRRDMSRSALFDVWVDLLTISTKVANGMAGNGLEEPVIKDHGRYSTKFDLTFTFIEQDGKLRLTVDYNTDIYDKDTIIRIIDHFKMFLTSAVKQPDIPVGKLEYLTTREKDQLLSDFGVSAANYPETRTVVDLFEEQAIRVPNNVAVVFKGSRLTYKQLNENANQVAHYLRGQGIMKGDMVIVSVNRCLELIPCILGVMKAGAIFVPIDQSFPENRIKYIIEETNCKLTLLDGSQDWESIGQMPVNSPDEKINAEELAYVMYTSGSTGNPKGVMVMHRSLTNHIWGIVPSANLGCCASFGILSSLAADLNYSILFAALVSGAAVHVISKELLFDGIALANYLKLQRVDCIKIVPSLWLQYAEEGAMVLPCRVIIFGGEAVPVKILNYLREARFEGDIYNHYGPTEATIGVLIHKIELTGQYTQVPTGKPFARTRIYILDKNKNLCPAGVIGELFIGGDGVAKGYYNNAELTKDRFIKNPFVEGGIMYRSGDVAKWLPSGNVQYLNRADDQVKIHGYRVELGEIEHVLLDLPDVKMAKVIPFDQGEGERVLVGYIVSGKVENAMELRQILLRRLPEYMVPYTLVQLESMPLTPNGKTDRKALTFPRKDATNQSGISTGRSATEIELIKIYEKILNKGNISIRDNFFDLGGNSMLLIRIGMEIKRKLGVLLSVTQLYEISTIEEAADMVDSIIWLRQKNPASSDTRKQAVKI